MPAEREALTERSFFVVGGPASAVRTRLAALASLFLALGALGAYLLVRGATMGLSAAVYLGLALVVLSAVDLPLPLAAALKLKGSCPASGAFFQGAQAALSCCLAERQGLRRQPCLSGEPSGATSFQGGVLA